MVKLPNNIAGHSETMLHERSPASKAVEHCLILFSDALAQHTGLNETPNRRIAVMSRTLIEARGRDTVKCLKRCR